MSRAISKPIVAAIAFALGVTVTGGVAAVAASRATTVKACESSKGFLATATKGKCPKHTHALKLGVKGPRGAAGANGLSQALVGVDVSQDFTGPSGDLSTSTTKVLDIANAPAGDYVLNYTFNATNQDGTGAADSVLSCNFTVGDTEGSVASQQIGMGDEASVSGTETATLTAPTSIGVDCHSTVSTTVAPSGGDLTAIRVNQLIQPPK